jgi:NAD(P)H dehydrogenase (quinone)
MFAIMGVTGQVGGATAGALLATGQKVRAIVRNPEKAAEWKQRGAEIAIADYDDSAALAAAFQGVAGVFIMIPPNFTPAPGFPEAQKNLATLQTALLQAKPPKIVCLSSIGSEQPKDLGLITATHLQEQILGALPIPSAFLRAGWFMENNAWDLASASEQGKLFSYLQPLDREIPMVATEDIGRTAAKLLQESWNGNRYIEVAGPRNYSPNRIAATFTEILGKTVEAVVVPRADWQKNFVAQGMPADRTAPRMEMVDSFNSGWIHFDVAGTEHVKGTVELKQVLQKFVQAN